MLLIITAREVPVVFLTTYPAGHLQLFLKILFQGNPIAFDNIDLGQKQLIGLIVLITEVESSTQVLGQITGKPAMPIR